MGNFFKRFGKGILYVIVCPLAIAALAIAAVIGIFIFFYTFLKSIFFFFTGRSLKDDLPEDIEAKARLQGNSKEDEDNTFNIEPEPEIKEEPTQTISVYPSDSSMYSSPYNELKENQNRELSDPNKMTDISIDEGGDDNA